jgi:hypothetical protein
MTTDAFFSRHVLNSFDGVPDHQFSTANVRHRIYEKVYESSGHRESRAMVPRSPRRTGSRVLDPTEDPGDVDHRGNQNPRRQCAVGRMSAAFPSPAPTPSRTAASSREPSRGRPGSHPLRGSRSREVAYNVSSLRILEARDARRGGGVDVRFDLSSKEGSPRHGGPRIRCPRCGWEPERDSRWSCSCLHSWNTFDTEGRCPACGRQWVETQCLRCHQWSPHREWYIDEPET